MACPRPPCFNAGRRATDKDLRYRSLVSSMGARTQDALEAVHARISEGIFRTRELVLAPSSGVFGCW